MAVFTYDSNLHSAADILQFVQENAPTQLGWHSIEVKIVGKYCAIYAQKLDLHMFKFLLFDGKEIGSFDIAMIFAKFAHEESELQSKFDSVFDQRGQNVKNHCGI